MHVLCLRCKECRDWVKSPPDLQKLLVEVITVRKDGPGKVLINEEEAHCEAFGKYCALWFDPLKEGGKDKRKDINRVKCVMEIRVKEVAHKMIECGSEEDSGNESVEMFA